MRVLLIDPSSHGGLPLYTDLVARGLQQAGADPEILASRVLGAEPGSVRLIKRLPALRWTRPRRAGPGFYLHRAWTWTAAALVISQEARRRRPDVLHFQAPINRRFDAALVGRLSRRIPVVWTAHDVLPHERTDRDAAWFAAIYRAADRVIVHSEPAAAELYALAGVSPVVVPHPVADDVLRVSRDEARRRLGLPEEGRILAAVGFIRPYKGYALLADVWESLGGRAPMLLVMGELLADEERPVVDRLRASGADVRLGYASEVDLQLAMSAADALLLPYASASDSGIVHLARALGVPVIASDAPQLAATVRGSGAGVVLPRDVEAWRAAVTGVLPPPPAHPPTLRSVGEAHLAVYAAVLEQRRSAVRRVVFYTDATQIAGAEHSLGHLVAALSPRFDVTIVGVDRPVVDWLASQRPQSRSYVLPPVRNKYDVGSIARHVSLFLKLHPDIVHVNLRQPFSCQYATVAGLLTPGAQVVAVEQFPTPAADELQLRLKRLTSRFLAAHVGISDSSARTVERMLGLRRGAVRTIHHGIDPSAPEPAPRISDRPIVGAVGRFSEQKGLDVYLHALALVPDVAGVIVGDGPDRPQLEQLVDELGLDGRVELTGWRGDARSMIGMFDVLVVPSRFEPLGLVAVEGMAAGVPVVASRVDGLAEVVADGEAGFLVPPDDAEALADAIRRALRPDFAERARERGPERVRELFSAERMARNYEALYDELCRGR